MDAINPSGKYVLGKLRSTGGRIFGKAKREILGTSKERKTFLHLADSAPGPGSYLLPSEFGKYVSSKVAKEVADPLAAKK